MTKGNHNSLIGCNWEKHFAFYVKIHRLFKVVHSKELSHGLTQLSQSLLEKSFSFHFLYMLLTQESIQELFFWHLQISIFTSGIILLLQNDLSVKS